MPSGRSFLQLRFISFPAAGMAEAEEILVAKKMVIENVHLIHFGLALLF